MLGKISASLSDKLKNVKWGEYKLGDLFEIVGTKSLDSNAIEFTETGINFIGRTSENNGIQGKIQKRNFEPNEPYTITATVIGNYKYVKYQKERYYCSQNINKLTPKNIITCWNEKIAYFFVTNIQKFVSLYDNQQSGYKLDDIKNHLICLPVKNKKIDFNFMESLISELEKEHVNKLSNFLNENRLDDYELTFEEKELLENYKEIQFEEYSISNFFEVLTPKKRFDANKVNVLEKGIHPYIVRMSTNNGQKGYIDENTIYLNDANTLSFGQDTATVFYQKNPYFTSDKIKILRFKNGNLNSELGLYFVSAIFKSFSKFFWGASSFSVDVIKNQKIKVPVKNENIDIETMESLIKLIKKLVIKDVVKYTDKKIITVK